MQAQLKSQTVAPTPPATANATNATNATPDATTNTSTTNATTTTATVAVGAGQSASGVADAPTHRRPSAGSTARGTTSDIDELMSTSPLASIAPSSSTPTGTAPRTQVTDIDKVITLRKGASLDTLPPINGPPPLNIPLPLNSPLPPHTVDFTTAYDGQSATTYTMSSPFLSFPFFISKSRQKSRQKSWFEMCSAAQHPEVTLKCWCW